MGCDKLTLMGFHGCLRLALLAALGLLTITDADAASGPSGGVSVASSAELSAAVVMGAPHILITQHLNLRDEQMALTLAVVQNKTRSIRGHCTEKPPAGLVASTATAPLLPRRPGQCILVNHVLDIGQRNEGSATAPQRLWLHNLYLRRDGGLEGHATINVKNTGAEAWLTDITVQDLTEKGSVGLFLSRGVGGVHAERCTFAHLSGSGGAIKVRGGTLAVVDTAFRGFVGVVVDGYGGSVVLKNVTLEDRTASYNPLIASSPGSFLSPNNPWLLATQTEACQGKYTPSSWARDIVTAPCPNVAGFDTMSDMPLPASKSRGRADTGAVVGGAVVIMVAAAVAAGLVALTHRRRRRSHQSAESRSLSKTNNKHAPQVDIESRVPGTSYSGMQQCFQEQAPAEQPPPVQACSPSTPHPYPPMPLAGRIPSSASALGPSGRPRPHPGLPKLPSTSLPQEGPKVTHASSEPTLLKPSTAAISGIPTFVADGREKLEDALNATRRADALLCGRYEVLAATERCTGTQGYVRFVFDRRTRVECAIKFFFVRNHFDHECALYVNSTLRTAMVALREVCANDDGAIKAANGAILPPFIVHERGESLDEFQQLSTAIGAQHGGRIDIVTAAQSMLHTAACVAALHRLGWVHRDLKPGSVLRVPRSHSWTLIDFGCAARIGQQASIEFTPAYAAPEVVRAYLAGLPTVVASPAMDIWALGLVAYELLTGERPFRLGAPNEEILAVLAGQGRLPWEGADGDSAAAARLVKLGMFKRGVLQCLERDPEQRPALASILASWQHVFMATTTAASSISSGQTFA